MKSRMIVILVRVRIEHAAGATTANGDSGMRLLARRSSLRSIDLAGRCDATRITAAARCIRRNEVLPPRRRKT
jgi:hypothetical protein